MTYHVVYIVFVVAIRPVDLALNTWNRLHLTDALQIGVCLVLEAPLGG